MAVFKCKMCGGQLEITEDSSICTCEYCGAEQTLPKVMDENLQSLFNRANVLRMKAEFDKASEIYEKILQASGTEAEAYWGLILCKYGIEYVEDPATYKRVPTCHRASFDAVTADDDYKMALQYADMGQRTIYEREAKQIDEIQKGIVALAQNEDPYDVFICYKETDESGKRTVDSVIANDIYHQLTQEGFKVFYAAITLEDILGKDYESYIFSALNSSKVMLSIGTKPEYFNAVWVKNEWSRFLKIMKKDRARVLIPCYKDMDAYELPEEFAHLQAQDMSKIGFINDIVRGIKKVVGKDDATGASNMANAASPVQVQQVAVPANNNEALLKRGNMALEDGEWDKADGFFEDVLNQDAECAEAYLGKLFASLNVRNITGYINYYVSKRDSKSIEDLTAVDVAEDYINNKVKEYAIEGYLKESTIRELYEFNLTYKSELKSRKRNKTIIERDIKEDKLYIRVMQYAGEDIKKQLEDAYNSILQRYDEAIKKAEDDDKARIASLKNSYKAHIASADSKAKAMHDEAVAKREEVYQGYVNKFDNAEYISEYEDLRRKFVEMNGYSFSNAYIGKCDEAITKIKEKENVEKAKQAKKWKIIIGSIAGVIAVCVAVMLLVTKVIIPMVKYNDATALLEDGKYDEAATAFDELDDYSDSVSMVKESNYQKAAALLSEGKYVEANALFEELVDYSDAADKAKESKYQYAAVLVTEAKYDEAIGIYKKLGEYKDASEMITESTYQKAEFLFENGKLDSANEVYGTISGYKDVTDKVLELKYQTGLKKLSEAKYLEAIEILKKVGDYKDSKEQIKVAQKSYYNSLSKGSIIEFGTYQGESIEWKVLAKNNGKVLIITKNVIDCIKYNNTYKKVTWKSSTIRKWLNNTFIKNAFTKSERKKICKTTVKNSNNKEYGTSGGKNTKDRIFILSFDEAKNYFSSDNARIAYPTEYAIEQAHSKDYLIADCGGARWWLRSPGDSQRRAMDVYGDGSCLDHVTMFGTRVNHDGVGIRPTMWLNLEP